MLNLRHWCLFIVTDTYFVPQPLFPRHWCLLYVTDAYSMSLTLILRHWCLFFVTDNYSVSQPLFLRHCHFFSINDAFYVSLCLEQIRYFLSMSSVTQNNASVAQKKCQWCSQNFLFEPKIKYNFNFWANELNKSGGLYCKHIKIVNDYSKWWS